MVFTSGELIHLLVGMHIKWDDSKISTVSIAQIPFGYLYFQRSLFFMKILKWDKYLPIC